ncbi:MAG: hypothetical protein ACFHX7_09315 [Pseudomonadota bacterium]
MKTGGNRFLVELLSAMLLTLMAHAVYAIDHLVGALTFDNTSNNVMKVELHDRTAARVPAPVQLRVDHLSSDRSFFCLDFDASEQGIDLQIPRNLQLVSDDGSLPYDLEFAGACATRGEIGFNLVVDEQVRQKLARDVFADTVIVFINPE